MVYNPLDFRALAHEAMEPINPLPERSITHDEVEDQRCFELLLAELSTRFVHLRADEVDANIEEAQRLFCESLGLDRSGLWQFSSREPGVMLLTHMWERGGSPVVLKPTSLHPARTGEWLLKGENVPPVYLQANSDSLFPWTFQQLRASRTVIIPCVEDLPQEAARDRETYRRIGTKSTVIVSLVPGGELLGCLTFGAMRQARDWPDDLVQRFCMVADLFAHVLARRRSEMELRESEERLSLAADSAEAGLWSLDPERGRFWATGKIRSIFQFPQDTEITMDSFLAVVHPEDRERVDKIVQETFEERREVRAEYRIILPDGGVRWIASRGRPRLDAAGRPDRLMGISMDVTERKQKEELLARSLNEIRALRDQLQAETEYLREEVIQLKETHEIVGQSAAIRQVLEQIEQVAPTDASVLILGETGTGKELIARAIHRCSPRKKHTMIVVNCGSLPEGLIESELFGREKGAYTDALTRQAGRFELAHKSTLFLDEIGDLPPGLQAKLLRVLQDGTFERLGSTRTLTANVRIIAATHRDLSADVAAGKFREDLFYRLSVFPIQVPPLRERREDIPVLVRAFVAEFGRKMGKEIETVPKRSIDALANYSWPGNIRELRNVIEHAVIVSRGRTLEVRDPARKSPAGPESLKLDEIMSQHILSVLERTSWKVKGPDGAAELLGLKPTTLFSKMKKLGLPTRRKKYENPE
jgi:PAS domain S-box-containing protein